ncbi:prenylcysteine lyase [Aspergillus nomiae NRRL 13137]|uniref:Prenylcysteine lyase n=1 Tax=Aspergillus nomiae NRRL (strain ATCC 15546 / NRRL 13137 / CBS 260.88 / M93) TaxID=1509407 RepID=A0A0L1IR47_ASPN3|nr:prenylcysteine lyase [Aspergillus nomiae NRRL 13137]KNG81870.1 prenylcysteine lyase [Aspergillus nomiae NRRL 13137]
MAVFVKPSFWLLAIHYVIALCFISLGDAKEHSFTQASDTVPKRVAIIGAGAGGSSTAYSLRKHADASSIPVNITVFERDSYVGGRSTTVNVLDHPAYPVELGASIFVKVNYNLMNASKELGLFVDSADAARPKEADDSIGVWDGKQFVFVLQSNSWWNIPKLLWRYGWAPIRTQNLMKSTVNKFLKLYEEPMFPFRSLTAAAAAVGLLDSTSTPGDVFLKENNISPDFSRDIIQASTRVNYGQNLGLIHGLESMVCMATDGAVSIKGGNWQIFQGMLKAAQADVRLNHTVTSIQRNADNTLTLTYKANNSKEQKLVFDEVVIAGPLQHSELSITPPVEKQPDEIPFVTLHVTLFSSPHKLSPKFFNLQGASAQTPETILTTVPSDLDLGSEKAGVGPTGFWSISTLQTVDHPPASPDQNSSKHYVYKVFSPEQLSADFVRSILGLESPSDPVKNNSTIGDLSRQDISWHHEKVWYPYPFLYPRVTFEETLLSPNIWYTGGIESFISTMETSALMGKNVATLLFQSWQEQKEGTVDDDPVVGWEERVEL